MEDFRDGRVTNKVKATAGAQTRTISIVEERFRGGECHSERGVKHVMSFSSSISRSLPSDYF
jgi:hypothetical protein